MDPTLKTTFRTERVSPAVASLSTSFWRSCFCSLRGNAACQFFDSCHPAENDWVTDSSVAADCARSIWVDAAGRRALPEVQATVQYAAGLCKHVCPVLALFQFLRQHADTRKQIERTNAMRSILRLALRLCLLPSRSKQISWLLSSGGFKCAVLFLGFCRVCICINRWRATGAGPLAPLVRWPHLPLPCAYPACPTCPTLLAPLPPRYPPCALAGFRCPPALLALLPFPLTCPASCP